MSTPNNTQISTVIQVLQLVLLAGTISGLALTLGRKDAALSRNSEEIAELTDISFELVRTTIESTATNREQDRRLDDLRERITTLESTN